MSDKDIKETKTETVTELENLDTAGTADKEAIKNLATMNSKRTTELLFVNQKLVRAMDMFEGLL